MVRSIYRSRLVSFVFDGKRLGLDETDLMSGSFVPIINSSIQVSNLRAEFVTSLCCHLLFRIMVITSCTALGDEQISLMDGVISYMQQDKVTMPTYYGI